MNENTTCKQSALRFFPLSTIFAKIFEGGVAIIDDTDEFVIEFPLGVVDDDNGDVDTAGALYMKFRKLYRFLSFFASQRVRER